jgi:hypothetical protein
MTKVKSSNVSELRRTVSATALGITPVAQQFVMH